MASIQVEYEMGCSKVESVLHLFYDLENMGVL